METNLKAFHVLDPHAYLLKQLFIAYNSYTLKIRDHTDKVLGYISIPSITILDNYSSVNF